LTRAAACLWKFNYPTAGADKPSSVETATSLNLDRGNRLETRSGNLASRFVAALGIPRQHVPSISGAVPASR
jgi:hypothetical protein